MQWNIRFRKKLHRNAPHILRKIGGWSVNYSEPRKGKPSAEKI